MQPQEGGGGAAWVKPVSYAALNIVSASGIVFANKAVFTTYGFKFTCALTWVHTVFTLVGMRLFLAAGLFEAKKLPAAKMLPLAAAYVGYIVLCNLSLNINPVSFYQIMKIAVAPTVLALELILHGKVPTPLTIASVLVVCAGVAISTVSDAQVASNATGLLVGLAATLCTAMYQIWAGTKQKQLRASSTQLLHQYTPQAALLLGLLVPLMEPTGLFGRPPPDAAGPYGDGTILGYNYTPAAVAAIVVSALLGLAVSLSTFLVIASTSALTYNVVGHLKTVIILTGGCLMFGDSMPPRKLLGICVAMAGIVWYSLLQLGMGGAGGGSGGAAGGGGALKGLASADADKRAADAEPLLPVIAVGPRPQLDGGVQPAGSRAGSLSGTPRAGEPGGGGGGGGDGGGGDGSNGTSDAGDGAVPRDQRATARASAAKPARDP